MWPATGYVFFIEKPDASGRPATTVHHAEMLSLLSIDQRLEATRTAQRATSWNTLPQWLLNVVELVEGGPAFEVLAGHPTSRVVIHVPHLSTYIPPWIRENIHLSRRSDCERTVRRHRRSTRVLDR